MSVARYSDVPEQGTLIHTDWKGYLRISRVQRDRPMRVTFDRGVLELMTLSSEHERVKSMLRIFLETVLTERGIDFSPGGSTTFRRRDLQRGLEPDECYWVEHWQAMVGRPRFNPLRHPPPDLAIEVEVTRSMLDRIGIYQALKVPEIWRWPADDSLMFLSMTSSGEYQEVPHSRYFPQWSSQTIAEQVLAGLTMSTARWIRHLREWAKPAPTPERESI